VLKKIRRVFLYLFLSSLAYVLITKFVDPPITTTQITNAFGLGLRRDYVSWENMSYNIKLAAIASEDQAFTDHIGFDWDAIEKSLRPKKKKKKSKIPLGGGASTISQQTAKNVFLWQGSG
jgi:monofunctional biosynthetic peptidoglycan transglycosylase